MKMFEYMAAKKAIVSSDLPVIREVLNEDNSILVEPDNIQLLSFYINKMCKISNLDYRKMVDHAKKESEKYQINRIISRWREIL